MRSMIPCFSLMALACAPTVEEGPLEGPGVDDQGRIIVDAEALLVGLTHLQVKNAPKPGKRFGELATAVGEGLYEDEPEGWVGAAFRNEGKLEQWTMTVWESEEALMAFVISDHHTEAMAAFDSVSVGGETRSLWMPTEDLPLSWDDALDLLQTDPDTVYGDSKWYED